MALQVDGMVETAAGLVQAILFPVTLTGSQARRIVRRMEQGACIIFGCGPFSLAD